MQRLKLNFDNIDEKLFLMNKMSELKANKCQVSAHALGFSHHANISFRKKLDLTKNSFRIYFFFVLLFSHKAIKRTFQVYVFLLALQFFSYLLVLFSPFPFCLHINIPEKKQQV